MIEFAIILPLLFLLFWATSSYARALIARQEAANVNHMIGLGIRAYCGLSPEIELEKCLNWLEQTVSDYSRETGKAFSTRLVLYKRESDTVREIAANENGYLMPVPSPFSSQYFESQSPDAVYLMHQLNTVATVEVAINPDYLLGRFLSPEYILDAQIF